MEVLQDFICVQIIRLNKKWNELFYWSSITKKDVKLLFFGNLVDNWEIKTETFSFVGSTLTETKKNCYYSYFFGSEGLWCRQVLAIVVAQMIVADYGHGFDARPDQKVHQHGLQLGLTGLEVVSGNKHLLLLRQVYTTRNKCVLGRTIDVRHLQVEVKRLCIGMNTVNTV